MDPSHPKHPKYPVSARKNRMHSDLNPYFIQQIPTGKPTSLHACSPRKTCSHKKSHSRDRSQASASNHQPCLQSIKKDWLKQYVRKLIQGEIKAFSKEFTSNFREPICALIRQQGSKYFDKVTDEKQQKSCSSTSPSAITQNGSSSQEANKKQCFDQPLLRRISQLERLMGDVMGKVQVHDQELEIQAQSSQEVVLSMRGILSDSKKKELAITESLHKLVLDIDEKNETMLKLQESVRNMEAIVMKKFGKNTTNFIQNLTELNQNNERHSKAIESMEADLSQIKQIWHEGFGQMNSLLHRIQVIEEQHHARQTQLKKHIQEEFTELRTSLENYLSEVIQSYNDNFANLQESQGQVQEFNREILKLIKSIALKLETLATKQNKVEGLLKSVQQLELTLSKEVGVHNNKLRQVVEKGFELEHELKSAKLKLECVEGTLSSRRDIISTGGSLDESMMRLQQDCKSICFLDNDQRIFDTPLVMMKMEYEILG